MKLVHMIGIGGSGLSAIATILLESGIEVTGSDQQESEMIDHLRNAGAQVTIGHRAENVGKADVVIRSSAIPDENVEVTAALLAGIQVLKRADFLPVLTSGKKVIAIAGTHGKTTCTAMIAFVLTRLGRDPSYIIGGVSRDLGNNAHAGKGEFFVIEADEYDGMFWGLKPEIAVVTNVEHDHPDCYPTEEDFYQAFLKFIHLIEVGGTLIVCAYKRRLIRKESIPWSMASSPTVMTITPATRLFTPTMEFPSRSFILEKSMLIDLQPSK